MSAAGTEAAFGKDAGDFKILARHIGMRFVKKSRRGSRIFTALEDITLDVRPGEFLSIVGPSGCGKSTFLDIIAGLSRQTEGVCSIDGQQIDGPALDRGIVMQGYALFPWLSVQKNVEFGLRVKGIPVKQRRQIALDYLELVGLSDFASHYPYELSGGMKQRVAIARALAYDPKVLLMDEPFAAIDEQNKELLHEELLRIWEKTKKTILFVTHSIDEAVFLSDRIAVFSTNPGRLKTVLDVDLPRPRYHSLRSSQKFAILRQRLWELLQNNGCVDAAAGTVRRADGAALPEELSPDAMLWQGKER